MCIEHFGSSASATFGCRDPHFAPPTVAYLLRGTTRNVDEPTILQSDLRVDRQSSIDAQFPSRFSCFLRGCLGQLIQETAVSIASVASCTAQ